MAISVWANYANEKIKLIKDKSVHAQHTAVLLFETRKLIYKTTRTILPRQLTPICPFICGKPIEFATFSRTVSDFITSQPRPTPPCPPSWSSPLRSSTSYSADRCRSRTWLLYFCLLTCSYFTALWSSMPCRILFTHTTSTSTWSPANSFVLSCAQTSVAVLVLLVLVLVLVLFFFFFFFCCCWYCCYYYY